MDKVGASVTDSLVGTIHSEPISSASQDAGSVAALAILGEDSALQDPDAVSFSAYTIEVVALRLALAGGDGAKAACREAFELLRAVLQDGGLRSALSALEASRARTRAALFGVLGEVHAQTRKLLEGVEGTGIVAAGWGTATELVVLDVWQLLIRKRGWGDLNHPVFCGGSVP